MSDEMEQIESNDFQSDDQGAMNIVEKKKIRVLGKRGGYNRPKNKRVKYQNRSHREHNYEKSLNFSKSAKERYLYLPFYPLPDLSEFIGEIIELRIASEYLSQENKAFMEKRIYGSDIYTSDSDGVCILQHSGYFKIKDLAPTNIEGVSVFFRVTKGRTTYNSSFRNGIKSKKMSNFQGHSIKPENYILLKQLGSRSELLEMASKMPSVCEFQRQKAPGKKLNQNSFHNEYNMSFNLSFEMWLHYSIPAIADKGRELKDYTSWRLKDQVLYLESLDKRYEIARNVSDHTNDDYLFEEYETFRISVIKDPVDKDNEFMSTHPVPLPDEHVHTIFSRLDWHELQWGHTTLVVRNFNIDNLKCFNFYNIR